MDPSAWRRECFASQFV